MHIYAYYYASIICLCFCTIFRVFLYDCPCVCAIFLRLCTITNVFCYCFPCVCAMFVCVCDMFRLCLYDFRMCVCNFRMFFARFFMFLYGFPMFLCDFIICFMICLVSEGNAERAFFGVFQIHIGTEFSKRNVWKTFRRKR